MKLSRIAVVVLGAALVPGLVVCHAQPADCPALSESIRNAEAELAAIEQDIADETIPRLRIQLLTYA